MDLEHGTTLDVKIYRNRIINIEHHVGGGFSCITLTTDEARTLANTLLAAVHEIDTGEWGPDSAAREGSKRGDTRLGDPQTRLHHDRPHLADVPCPWTGHDR